MHALPCAAPAVTHIEPEQVYPVAQSDAAEQVVLHGAAHLPTLPPPPQVWPTGHVPHAIVLPQPSVVVPQKIPWLAHVEGEHVVPEPVGAPHLNGVPPPPQVVPDVHAPQLMRPPQPSPTMPHEAPTLVHDRGVHAGAQPYGEQEKLTVDEQLPDPLHAATVTAPADVQLASPHTSPCAGSVHAVVDVPSHVPMHGPEPAQAARVVPCGGVPAGTAVHVPSAPATSHAWHCPVHGWSQQ